MLVAPAIPCDSSANPGPDPMQLVDELSMIYTACLMCYATFSFSKSQAFRQVLGTGLVSLAAFITVSAMDLLTEA